MSTPDDGLLAYDREHLWHPYTSMTDPTPVREVVGADGVRLRLADGTELVDGMSSWWAAIHGYRHPALDAALAAQAGDFSHVMFGGLTHAPAVRLAERLVEISPAGLERVFLADSGSVSVEVALKMVLQAQRGAGRPERTRMLTVRGGYHGDTFGCMSVCDPVGGMHTMFADTLPRQVFAPRPPGRRGRRRHLGGRGRHAGRGARPRAGRDHRRADPPGRRWHARLSGRVPAGAAPGRRRARPGAGVRRDRHRVRPHRHDVRRRRGRRLPRHHVRRQGPDRRLPHPRRGALHAGDRRADLRLGVRGADARADVHGQPARLRGGAGQPRPARGHRLGGRGGPDQPRPHHRARRLPRPARA